jgi:hypothetical protein
MKRLSLRVDDALHYWIANEAKQKGCAKSEIVRKALNEHHKAGRQSLSLHDLMKEACGTFKNGPRNLSRKQKKCMDGFAT